MIDLELSNLQNNPDAVSIDHNGRFTLLCIWRHAREGRFAALWHIVAGARVDTANFFDRIDAIRNNARLADSAKADDSKEAARGTLGDLGEQQRRLNKIAADLDAERLKLAEIPPADAGQAVVDVGIASFFRELKEPTRNQLLTAMVEGSESRMVDALLRLPAPLFGVSPQMRATIEANAIVRRAPGEVREVQQVGEAARTAQMALSKCVELVTSSCALSLEERMVSLGSEAWQPHIRDGAPDALAALARRYGAETN